MRKPFLNNLLRHFHHLLSQRTPAPESTPDEPCHPWEKVYPEGIDWAVEIEPKPVMAILDGASSAYPDNVCVSFHGRGFRYREIAELANRAAKGFQALGVHKGIKVALMMPNTPYSVICFYGVLKAGGTVVNINPLYPAREIERQITEANVCILATLDIPALYQKVAACLDANRQLERVVICSVGGILPFRKKALLTLLKRKDVAAIPDDDRHIRYEKLIDNDGDPDPVETDPVNDIAVLQYTGGTTGFPKSARLTHANLFANVEQVLMWAPGVELGKEKILGALPLFHAFGMTVVMNLGLRIGAEMILLPNFRTAEVLKTINHQRPTVFTGVPTMYSALNASHDLTKDDLSSLKYCISGGAPLPVEVQRRFEELTGCPLVEGFGLTEAGPVCTLNPLGGLNKTGSVGLPLPGTVVKIVSLDEPERTLPPMESGEICITGPQVMAGYANRAQENIDIFLGGFLHTGDVGYLDEDGYLFIIDRIKDLILSSGFSVYPRMVEEAIYLHSAVEEVAVCGIPDQHRGEAIKAFIKLRDGQKVKATELRIFLKDKLASFQMPRKFEFRSELPKTMIGKISKKDLVAEKMEALPNEETISTNGG